MFVMTVRKMREFLDKFHDPDLPIHFLVDGKDENGMAESQKSYIIGKWETELGPVFLLKTPERKPTDQEAQKKYYDWIQDRMEDV